MIQSFENSCQDFFIPIDEEVANFHTYLKSMDRAILSARFGDGKSTFLGRFAEEYGNEYVFFTIYPLNYQIAENRDIMEYIKRDLLMQMLSHYEFRDEDWDFISLLEGYYQENKSNILKDIIDSIPNINIAGIGTDIIKKPLLNLIKNAQQFKEYKTKKKAESETKKARKFFEAFNEYKGSIYEFDTISQLICRIVQQIKTTEKKNVVLVVEDLDRVDPAHIFRILNILSAHIERNSPGLIEWNATKGSNKFDFDKILLVCDFENIEQIYHHFYGCKADFKGYISKFSSIAPFNYSLRHKYSEYLAKLFDIQFQRYSRLLEVLTDTIINKKSKDERYNSLRFFNDNIGKYLILDKTIEFEEHRHNLRDNNLLKLLCILKMFNIEFDTFCEIAIDSLKDEFINFIGVSWLIEVDPNLKLECDFKHYKISTHKKQWSNTYTTPLHVLLNKDDSIFNIEFDSSIVLQNLNGSRIIDTLPKIAQELEKYIIK